jgi:hypothetical protein
MDNGIKQLGLHVAIVNLLSSTYTRFSSLMLLDVDRVIAFITCRLIKAYFFPTR